MQVFTATKATQGQRDNDFSWSVEGELVIRHPSECGSGSVDDGCGCRRALAGMASSRATTTFVATELDIEMTLYAIMIFDAFVREGWDVSGQFGAAVVSQVADEMQRIAGKFRPGTVVERRGNVYVARTGPLPGRIRVGHRPGFAATLHQFRDRTMQG